MTGEQARRWVRSRFGRLGWSDWAADLVENPADDVALIVHALASDEYQRGYDDGYRAAVELALGKVRLLLFPVIDRPGGDHASEVEGSAPGDGSSSGRA